MRNLFTLAIALMLTTSLAMAQSNNANIDQVGSTNDGKIVQDGSNNAASLGQGENTAAFTVWYPGVGQVAVDLTSGTSHGNIALITQAGHQNTALATQGGGSASAYATNNSIDITQDGQFNLAETGQGTYNGVAIGSSHTVDQLGQQNVAKVAQGSATNGRVEYSDALILQHGNSNWGRIDQGRGHVATHSFAEISQIGNSNTAHVLQSN